jgi:hypothetical protein
MRPTSNERPNTRACGRSRRRLNSQNSGNQRSGWEGIGGCEGRVSIPSNAPLIAGGAGYPMMKATNETRRTRVARAVQDRVAVGTTSGRRLMRRDSELPSGGIGSDREEPRPTCSDRMEQGGCRTRRIKSETILARVLGLPGWARSHPRTESSFPQSCRLLTMRAGLDWRPCDRLLREGRS